MTVHLPNDGDQHTPQPPSTKDKGRAGPAPWAVPMTAARLAELRGELEQMRRRTRLEFAQRLREARTYGDGSNNDEYHAVREEQMVLDARIASLEDTLARAIVTAAEDSAPGVAVIGSSVLIEDLASGARSRYRLASAHHLVEPDAISAASPIGRALIGAVADTTVTVDLPSGRSRSVRLVDVTTEGPAATAIVAP